MEVSYRPILLKKSAMVSTAEKYVLEIEIFTMRAEDSGLRFRIAARKKGAFSNQCAGSLEGPTFSNAIGQKLPFGRIFRPFPAPVSAS